MLVVLTCPNCGAQMEIDDSREFAFCQYCGTKIVNVTQEVKVTGPVTIDRRNEIDALIVRAMEFESREDYAKAQEYCDRILDIDPNNVIARAMEERLLSLCDTSNVIIVYNSELRDKVKLRVTLDGRNWHELSNGEQVALSLPVGKHRVLFSGTKSYTYDFVAKDLRKKITIVYTATKRKNTIDVK